MTPKLRVFFGSNLLKLDVASALKAALKEAKLDDVVEIEPLSSIGTFGCVKLSEETIAKVKEIEYMFADPDIAGQVCNLPDSRLKWVQATCAGIDSFLKNIDNPEKMKDVVITKHFQGLDKQMAEFVIGRILFRERHFDEIYEHQKQIHYAYLDHHLSTYRTLDQLSIGILGFGRIAKEVARTCGFMGMTIWTVVRDERFTQLRDEGLEHTDYVRPMSKLNEVLEACDYVINLLPSTPQTMGLLSGDTLRVCQQKKTVLINVGRGDLIDDDSLVHAIKSGWLGGAILDVYNQEPLPKSSPLWTLPGVIMSPHTSATVTSGKFNSIHSFIHNVKCFLDGKPMTSVADLSKGY